MKDAYYFSHDSNARTDPKIMAMMKVYGIEGYGRFWIIVETLAEQKGYKLPHKAYVYNAIAMQAQCERNDVEEYINACVNDFELLKSDSKEFWSESLLRRMTRKEENKEKRSAAGKVGAKARWGKKEEKSMPEEDEDSSEESEQDNKGIASECDQYADYSKGKESKVEESKVKESSSSTPTTEPKFKIINECMRIFGGNVSTKSVTAIAEFLNKNMSADIIIYAINKGMLKTGNQTSAYSYANKTLLNWYNEGKRDISDLSNGRDSPSVEEIESVYDKLW